jgi:WD40 repeat protein
MKWLALVLVVLVPSCTKSGQRPSSGPESKRVDILQGHASGARTVAISPDGKTLASGSYDRTIKLWDLSTGNERLTLKGHTDLVLSVTFSPDGKTLASGSFDHTAKLWDMPTGKERATLRGHLGAVHSVAFSPDGKTLASGSVDGPEKIKLWDVATWQERLAFKTNIQVLAVAFSPVGKVLASGSDDVSRCKTHKGLTHLDLPWPQPENVQVPGNLPVRSTQAADIRTVQQPAFAYFLMTDGADIARFHRLAGRGFGRGGGDIA